MSIREVASRIEELSIKAWTLDGVAAAVSDAVIEGPGDVRNYEGAVFSVAQLAHELSEESKQITEDLFALLRQDRSVT